MTRTIDPDDPVALRRNSFCRWAEAVGFQNVIVGNLGDPNSLEMRFSRGTNDLCNTAADAERWVDYIARGSQCQIEPGQIFTIVQGEQIAARFRLRPSPQPEHCAQPR